MSKLEAFNFFCAQWFWLRWATCSDGTQGVIFPVMPMTGWVSRYIPRHYRYIRVLGTSIKSDEDRRVVRTKGEE